MWFLLKADKLDSTFFALFQVIQIFLNKWFLFAKAEPVTLIFSQSMKLTTWVTSIHYSHSAVVGPSAKMSYDFTVP